MNLEFLDHLIRGIKSYVQDLIRRQEMTLTQIERDLKALRSRIAGGGGIQYRATRYELERLQKSLDELKNLAVALSHTLEELSRLEDLKWKLTGERP